MALLQDPDGVTHFPDIFDGGTLCGRSFRGWTPINPPHGDATCPDCMSDEDDDEAQP